MGGKSDQYYHDVMREIAEELNADDNFPVEVVNEGSANMCLRNETTRLPLRFGA